MVGGVVSVGVGVSVNVDVGSIDPVGVGVSVNVDVGSIDPVGVGVSVNVDVGSTDPVGVGVSVNVEVGSMDPVGVNVGVIVASSIIVRLAAPVDGRSVRMLSPFEMRAVQSNAACPACRPLALKVKTAPLAVALFPLLPATAAMKLPFCGSLIASAGSGPNRPRTLMLLTCTRAEL